MSREQFIKNKLSKVSQQSYWLGLIVGVVLGVIAGLSIGYQLGSPTTVVVPLTQGIRT